MEKTTQLLTRSGKLEDELAVLARNVADVLTLPASRRRPEQIAAAWAEIALFKPKTEAKGRLLRKIKKPGQIQAARRNHTAERVVYEKARGFLHRLEKWNEIERIVRRHKYPKKHSLLPGLGAARHDTPLNQIYTALHQLANTSTQNPAALELGCFADIAFPIESFGQLMSATYRLCLAQDPRRSMRFLDVGCGGGTKVFAATRYFAHADGLEVDLGYVNAARETLQKIGAGKSDIFHADASTFDSYANYDVIYYYRPLREDAILEQMEQRIIENALPGTILVAPYDLKMSVRGDLGCAHIVGPIYVTGIAQIEADQLRSDAEATGTEILRRSADWTEHAGYWAPILDSASFSVGSASKYD